MNKSIERTNLLKKNIIFILIIKGLSILISFLYVPLLLDSLDSDNYAIWLTLTSLVSWIALLDIGLGNGLRNRLSEALAEDNYALGKRYVSTAYCGVSIIAIIFLICFLLISPYIDWVKVLNAETIASDRLTWLVRFVFIGFILSFTFGLINSILYAAQLPAISSTITFTGQAISFIIVYALVKHFAVNDIVILGFVISGTPPLTYLLYSIYLFKYKFSVISPSHRYISFSKIRDILNLGLKFFCLQIISIILFQTNNIIIIHAINNDAVVIYNILYKYLYMLVTVYSMICAPIWSATTDAYVKKDFLWIKSIQKKLLKIAILFILGGLLMVILSKFVFKIWLGVNCPDIPLSCIIIMFIYCSFMILYSDFGYIINGIGKLQLQLYITAILAISYAPLAYFIGKNFGLQGVLLVMCFVGWANFMWSKIQFNKLLNGTARGIWDR